MHPIEAMRKKECEMLNEVEGIGGEVDAHGVAQEDTQPTKRIRRPIHRWARIGLVLIIGLGIVGGAIALAMISLRPPEETVAEPYDLFSPPDRGEILDPSRDHLLWTPDRRAWLYIPAGADLGEGRLMISSRRLELVPYAEDPIRRPLYGLDMVILRPDGSLDTEARSIASSLLCFQLQMDEIRRQDSGEMQFSIEQYVAGPSEWEWHEAQLAPGWEDGQVCAAIHELALYSLVAVASTPSTPLSTEPAAEPKGGLYEPPGLPELTETAAP